MTCRQCRWLVLLVDPKDSCEEILERADYVSDYRGGSGAVRDIICHVLKERGQWDEAIRQVYKL